MYLQRKARKLKSIKKKGSIYTLEWSPPVFQPTPAASERMLENSSKCSTPESREKKREVWRWNKIIHARARTRKKTFSGKNKFIVWVVKSAIATARW